MRPSPSFPAPVQAAARQSRTRRGHRPEDFERHAGHSQGEKGAAVRQAASAQRRAHRVGEKRKGKHDDEPRAPHVPRSRGSRLLEERVETRQATSASSTTSASCQKGSTTTAVQNEPDAVEHGRCKRQSRHRDRSYPQWGSGVATGLGPEAREDFVAGRLHALRASW